MIADGKRVGNTSSVNTSKIDEFFYFFLLWRRGGGGLKSVPFASQIGQWI